MAKFEVDLRDTEGTPAEFGDIVRVVLPEVLYEPMSEFGAEFHLPGRTVEGVLGFQLSRGLVVKVTRIIEGEPDEKFIGKTISLRYTVRDWFVVKDGLEQPTEGVDL